MPKIQIVVPCVNLWREYTKNCIDSLQTHHDYRILLIDNGSVDSTLVEAGKMVSEHFAHHRNVERWSCAQSWNFGVRDAFARGFDYVLILNNDVLLHPACIDQMVAGFAKEEGIGMISAMDIRSECEVPEDLFTKKSADYEAAPVSPHPSFSCFMINKECWDKVGEFDEGFQPCYFEDNDYHYRMKLSTVSALVYAPDLFYHFGSRTQNEALGGRPICPSPMFENNRAYFIRKWGGNPGSEKYTLPFNNIKPSGQTS